MIRIALLTRHAVTVKVFRSCGIPWQINPRFSSSSAQNVVPVFQRAHIFQEEIAIADQHGTHTYKQLITRSGHLAQLMQKLLGPDQLQQRVAFLCPNDVSYVITQWATWMAGHIAVPLSPLHPAPQLEYFVKDSQAAIIVATSDLAEKIQPILSGQQVIILEESLYRVKEEVAVAEEGAAAEEEAVEGAAGEGATGEEAAREVAVEEKLEPETQEKLEAEEVAEIGLDSEFYNASDALILYTSGTTGPPKGVVISHWNLHNQIQCLLQAWGWRSSDVTVHCLPLHHTHGIVNALCCPLHAGARTIMLPEFNAATVWGHLLSLEVDVLSRVTIFMAVPTIFAKLIEEYENTLVKNSRMREYVKSVSTQNIRLMISGSAALPVSIMERWKEITGHTLLERYGMTEIGMCLSNPIKGTRMPGFVGNPLPGVEVTLAQFSPNNQDYTALCHSTNKGTTVLADGEQELIGELLVKGPNIFKEYWNHSEATAMAFTEDGWFRTGDTAQYIDGAFKILGRTSVDIIKSGGFKISALDIERHLLSHPDISDVTVVGIPDITWGQKVAAVLVWTGSEEFDPVKLRSWAREFLPHYQVPSVILPTPAIPRNTMGKVNKKQIMKEFFPIVNSSS